MTTIIIELSNVLTEKQREIDLLQPTEKYKEVYGDSNSYTSTNCITDDNSKLDIQYTIKPKTDDRLTHIVTFYDILMQINYSEKTEKHFWLDFEEASIFRTLGAFLKKKIHSEISENLNKKIMKFFERKKNSFKKQDFLLLGLRFICLEILTKNEEEKEKIFHTEFTENFKRISEETLNSYPIISNFLELPENIEETKLCAIYEEKLNLLQEISNDCEEMSQSSSFESKYHKGSPTTLSSTTSFNLSSPMENYDESRNEMDDDFFFIGECENQEEFYEKNRRKSTLDFGVKHYSFNQIEKIHFLEKEHKNLKTSASPKLINQERKYLKKSNNNIDFNQMKIDDDKGNEKIDELKKRFSEDLKNQNIPKRKKNYLTKSDVSGVSFVDMFLHKTIEKRNSENNPIKFPHQISPSTYHEEKKDENFSLENLVKYLKKLIQENNSYSPFLIVNIFFAYTHHKKKYMLSSSRSDFFDIDDESKIILVKNFLSYFLKDNDWNFSAKKFLKDIKEIEFLPGKSWQKLHAKTSPLYIHRCDNWDDFFQENIGEFLSKNIFIIENKKNLSWFIFNLFEACSYNPFDEKERYKLFENIFSNSSLLEKKLKSDLEFLIYDVALSNIRWKIENEKPLNFNQDLCLFSFFFKLKSERLQDEYCLDITNRIYQHFLNIEYNKSNTVWDWIKDLNELEYLTKSSKNYFTKQVLEGVIEKSKENPISLNDILDISQSISIEQKISKFFGKKVQNILRETLDKATKTPLILLEKNSQLLKNLKTLKKEDKLTDKEEKRLRVKLSNFFQEKPKINEQQKKSIFIIQEILDKIDFDTLESAFRDVFCLIGIDDYDTETIENFKFFLEELKKKTNEANEKITMIKKITGKEILKDKVSLSDFEDYFENLEKMKKISKSRFGKIILGKAFKKKEWKEFESLFLQIQDDGKRAENLSEKIEFNELREILNQLFEDIQVYLTSSLNNSFLSYLKESLGYTNLYDLKVIFSALRIENKKLKNFKDANLEFLLWKIFENREMILKYFLIDGEKLERYLKGNFKEMKENAILQNEEEAKSENLQAFIDTLSKAKEKYQIENSAKDNNIDLEKYQNMDLICELLIKISSLQKLMKRINANGGINHINQMKNSELVDEYEVTQTDLSSLESLIDSLSLYSSKYGPDRYTVFQYFNHIYEKTGEIQKIIQNLVNQKKKIMELSIAFLDTNREERNILQGGVENCEYHFYFDKKEGEIQFKLVSKNKGRNKKFEWGMKELKPAIFRISIMSFDGVVGNDKEVKLMKVNTLHEIFKFCNRILRAVNKIYNSGLIFDLKTFSSTKLREIKNSVNFDNNYDFNIELENLSNSKINHSTRVYINQVSKFKIFYEFLQEEIKILSENSSEVLTTSNNHWLTRIYGSQFPNLIGYLLKKKTHTADPVRIYQNEQIEKYCLKKGKIEFKDNIYDIRGYKSLEFLQNAQVTEEQLHSSKSEIISRESGSKFLYYYHEGESFLYLLKFFALNNMGIYHRSFFLFCSPFTKKNEIDSFLQRTLFDFKKNSYFCIGLHNLTENCRNYFFKRIIALMDENKKKNTSLDLNKNLVIFFKNSEKSECLLTKFEDQEHSFGCIVHNRLKYSFDYNNNEKSTKKFQKNLQENVKTKIIVSSFSGLGKTTYIKKESKEHESELLTLVLSGDLSPKNIKTRLDEIELKLSQNPEKKYSLNIILDMMEDYKSGMDLIDQILFQIIFLKCLPNGDSFIFFDHFKMIYIEIGNTYKDVLVNCLSTIKLLIDPELEIVHSNRYLHEIKKITKKKIDINILKEYHFEKVTNYLKLIKTEKIDRKKYKKLDLSSDKRINLLKKYFIEGGTNKLKQTNYVQIINFLVCLEYNFKKFSSITGLSPENCPHKLRIQILEKIISLGRRFSLNFLPKLTDGKITFNKRENSAKIALRKVRERYIQRSDQMKKWEDWNEEENSTIFLGDDCLKFIYKNPLRLPNEMKQIIALYNPNSNGNPDFNKIDEYIPKYDDYSTDDYVRELCQAVGQGNEVQIEDAKKRFDNFGKGDGYVITKDNFLKILLIIQRSYSKIPIILQGETGCGKTYMVNFISSCLLQEEFRCFTLHGGVTEEELIERLKNYFIIAKQLKKNMEGEKKRLWILMDEFNTSPLQSLLCEIMKDRKCSFTSEINDVPENIVFIGCCNPYRLKRGEKMGKDEFAGMRNVASTGDIDDLQKKLSHNTNPIVDGLLNYVWDFGQLTDEAEAKYIEAQLEREAKKDLDERKDGKKTASEFFRDKEYTKIIRTVISLCHKKIREYENDSSVSLRDLKRFIQIFRYLNVLKNEYLDIENDKVEFILTLLVTTYICYFMRLTQSSDKIKLNDLISKYATKFVEEELKHKKFLKSKHHFGKEKGKEKEKEKRKLEINRIFEMERTFLFLANEIALSARQERIIDEDIALNKPLLENLFTSLISVQLNIPLILIGRPGTSKTLSLNILTKMLTNFPKKFSVFNKAEVFNFYGSLHTTGKSIREKFEKMEEYFYKKKRYNGENFLLIFDEIGLAENAPGKPLKTLHPILDPSSEDSLRKKENDNEVKEITPSRNFDMTEDFGNETYGDEKEDDSLSQESQSSSDPDSIKILTRKAEEMNTNKPTEFIKVFSFIGVSNSKLDVSNNNRALLVFRPDMEKKDLYETGVAILLTKFKENKNIQNVLNKDKENMQKKSEKVSTLLEVLVDSYVEFRKEETKEEFYKNFHGSRDFYSLIKYIERNMRADFFENISDLENGLCTLAFRSIDKNFSGRILQTTRASKLFKKICRKKLKKNGFTKLPIKGEKQIIELIKYNLDCFKSRFLMILTDGDYTDNILVSRIRDYVNKRDPQADKVVFLTGKGQDNTEEDNEEYLRSIQAKLPGYVEQGKTIIIKNLNKIHGCCYELYNQRYQTDERICNYLLDGHTKKIKVNKHVKIILLAENRMKHSQEFLKEYPAPFLNRFEKYYISSDDVLDKKSKKVKEEIEKKMKNIFKGENLESKLNSLIHGYSDELITTLAGLINPEAIKNNFNFEGFKKEEEDITENLKKVREIKDTVSSYERSKESKKLKISQEVPNRIYSKLYSLYSKGMLLHELSMEKKEQERNRLIDLYHKSHNFKDFNDFLDKFINRETKKKGIVFTYSPDCIVDTLISEDLKKKIVILTEEKISSDSDGMELKMMKFTLSEEKTKLLIIQFERKSKWDKIDFFKSKADEILSSESPLLKNKKILFLAHHNPRNTRNFKLSINFLTGDWLMQGFDELKTGIDKNMLKTVVMDIWQVFENSEKSIEYLKEILKKRVSDLYQQRIRRKNDRKILGEILKIVDTEESIAACILKNIKESKNQIIKKNQKLRKISILQLIKNKNLMNDFCLSYRSTIIKVIYEIPELVRLVDIMIYKIELEQGLYSRVLIKEIDLKIKESILKEWRRKVKKLTIGEFSNYKKKIMIPNNCFTPEFKEISKLIRKNFEESKLSLNQKKDEDYETKIKEEARKIEEVLKAKNLSDTYLTRNLNIWNMKSILRSALPKEEHIKEEVLEKIAEILEEKMMETDIIEDSENYLEHIAGFFVYVITNTKQITSLIFIIQNLEDSNKITKILEEIFKEKSDDLQISMNIESIVLKYLKFLIKAESTEDIKILRRRIIKLQESISTEVSSDLNSSTDSIDEEEETSEFELQVVLKILAEYLNQIVKFKISEEFEKVDKMRKKLSEKIEKCEREKKDAFGYLLELFELRGYEENWKFEVIEMICQNFDKILKEENKILIFGVILKFFKSNEEKCSNIDIQSNFNHLSINLIKSIKFNENSFPDYTIENKEEESILYKIDDFIKFDAEKKIDFNFLAILSDNIATKLNSELREAYSEKKNFKNSFKILVDRHLKYYKTENSSSKLIDFVIDLSWMRYLMSLDFHQICNEDLKFMDESINKVYDEGTEIKYRRSLSFFLIQQIMSFEKKKLRDSNLKKVSTIIEGLIYHDRHDIEYVPLDKYQKYDEIIQNRNFNLGKNPTNQILFYRGLVNRYVVKGLLDSKEEKNLKLCEEIIKKFNNENFQNLEQDFQNILNSKTNFLLSKLNQVKRKKDNKNLFLGSSVKVSILTTILHVFAEFEEMRMNKPTKFNSYISKQVGELGLILQDPDEEFTRILQGNNMLINLRTQSYFVERGNKYLTALWKCPKGHPFYVHGSGLLVEWKECPAQGCRSHIGGLGKQKIEDPNVGQKLVCYWPGAFSLENEEKRKNVNIEDKRDFETVYRKKLKEIERNYKEKKNKLNIRNFLQLIYPEFTSKYQAIFYHIYSQLILLYNEIMVHGNEGNEFEMEEVSPIKIISVLSQIAHDFYLFSELTKRGPAFVSILVIYISSKITGHFLNKKKEFCLELVREKITQIENLRENPTSIVIKYNEILRKQQKMKEDNEANRSRIYNLLKKSLSEKELYLIFKEYGEFDSVSYTFTKLLRVYNPVEMNQVIDSRETPIVYFIENSQEMLKYLGKIVIPMTRLALHISKHYSYNFRREEAKELIMEDFVSENNDDEMLGKLFENVESMIENHLPKFIKTNTYQELKFGYECQELTEFQKIMKNFIEKEEKCLSDFVFLLPRDDEKNISESFLEILIDELIKYNNEALDSYKEKFDEMNPNSEEILNEKIPLEEIQYSHFIQFPDKLEHIFERHYVRSTEFLKEDQPLLNSKNFERVISSKLLKGRKKINLVRHSLERVSFKFKNDPNTSLYIVKQIKKYFLKIELNPDNQEEIDPGFLDNLNKEDCETLEKILLLVLKDLKNTPKPSPQQKIEQYLDEILDNFSFENKSLKEKLFEVKINQLMSLGNSLIVKFGEFLFKQIYDGNSKDFEKKAEKNKNKLKIKNIFNIFEKFEKDVFLVFFENFEKIKSEEKWKKNKRVKIKSVTEKLNEYFNTDENGIFREKMEPCFQDLLWIYRALSKCVQ